MLATAILGSPLSDHGTLRRSDTISFDDLSFARPQTAEMKLIGERLRNSRSLWDNLVPDRSQTVDSKSGEMSEWSKEHAWKLIPFARADAHRNALTQFPPTTSRNNDVNRSVPVNHGV